MLCIRETEQVLGKSFLPGKAAGYDQIPMSVIKESILLVSQPLTHIINLSIEHGIVPGEMKIARVIHRAEVSCQFTANSSVRSVLPIRFL